MSHTISEIRNCLDDHPDDPKLIQTLPKRGYRLLEEPRPVGDAESAHSNRMTVKRDERSFLNALMRRGVIQAGIAYGIFSWVAIQVVDSITPTLGLPGWVPPFVIYAFIGGMPIVLILAWLLEQGNGHWFLDRGKQSGKLISGLERNYLAILVGFGIALVGATGYQVLVGFAVPTTTDIVTADEEVLLPVKANSVAVLRFLNINNDPTAQVFSDGLGEDVLDRLARVPGLAVASRGDSWSLPDNASSDLVRKRLRVAYHLEGSVRLIGNDLRVVVQLIETATGFHMFSRSFDRELSDLMAVQREITNLTIANMRIALPEGTSSGLVVTDIDPDLDAYVLYRRGKDVLDMEPTIDTIYQAIEIFEKALEIDDEYSAAHAGICQAYVTKYALTSESNNIELAETACNTALNTNPNLNVVYTALGQLDWISGNVARATSAYRRALELNPHDVLAMQGLARIFNRNQQFDEAERMLKMAIDLQPGNYKPITSLGLLYFSNGRYTEAAHAFRQVVFLDPKNSLGHGNLGSVLIMTGDFAAAIGPLNTSLSLEPRAFILSNLGIIYYYLGEYDRAVEMHRQAAEKTPKDNVVWLNLGDALQFSSQPDEAEDAYRKAISLSVEVLSRDPNDPASLCVQAWATAASGDADSGLFLIDRALNIAPDDPYTRYYDGLLKNARGEKEAAIDALRLALDIGYPAAMLATDPLLEGLHGDPRFESLIGENPKKIK